MRHLDNEKGGVDESFQISSYIQSVDKFNQIKHNSTTHIVSIHNILHQLFSGTVCDNMYMSSMNKLCQPLENMIQQLSLLHVKSEVQKGHNLH